MKPNLAARADTVAFFARRRLTIADAASGDAPRARALRRANKLLFLEAGECPDCLAPVDRLEPQQLTQQNGAEVDLERWECTRCGVVWNDG